MLTELRIQNFKAWRDTGDLRLAPLTILFGNNSSGKSSIHQFLLMLQQTVESPDRRRVLHFGDAATPVDLGGYADVVNGHDITHPLKFSLGWRLAEPLVVKDAKSGARYTGSTMQFSAEISPLGNRPPRLVVGEFDYRLAGNGRELELGLRRDAKGAYTLTSDGYQPVTVLGRKWPVSQPSNFHGFPDDISNRFQNLEFTSDLTLALETELGSMSYLGPLRDYPDRLYRWSGEEPQDVGWRGERTVDALLAGADRRFNRKARQRLRPLQVLVADWLKQLGLIDSFSVKPIGEERDEYEVRVRTPGRDQEELLTDVGFGVSQVLPVIVQCFYAHPDATVILEQPEIHLHPGAQAGLADLFLDALRIREEGETRDLQLIVESHSEHLLRRLLRRVAEEDLLLPDVAIYVVRGGRTGSTIEPLAIDEYGNVLNWPPGFFGDPLEDVTAQAERAVERRLAALP